MLINNQRPGVYSRYDLTSTYSTPRSANGAAVVARANGGVANTLYTFSSYQKAAEVFAPDAAGTHMLTCVKLLFDSGVSQVVAVRTDGDYAAALEKLEQVDNIGAVVFDASNAADIQLVKASVQRSADGLRERVGYCGVDDAEAAVAAARAVNCERIVICAPAAAVQNGADAAAVYTACALAGKVLAQNDCAYNWNGAEFPLLEPPVRLEEAVIQQLIGAGVTVFEQVGDAVECIRAVTTRTKTGTVEDRSMHSLNTILIVDDVMQSIRAALKLRLRGARVSAQSLQSISSQVTVELAGKQDDGILESFSPPSVYLDESDPSVCIVELSFKVAHVVSQIYITAHIQV